MNKRKRRCIAVIAAALLMCAAALFPRSFSADANSAYIGWYDGVKSMGTQMYDENCPLEVKHETLTFNINSFPGYYYDSFGIAQGYDARVTAEYTFYNPEETDVTATLAFPFGSLQYYMREEELWFDNERYDITADGAPIEKTLRHTYYRDSFETEADTARLRDDYIQDNFYTRDLEVTAYTYTINGISDAEQKNNAPYASFAVSIFDARRIFVSPYCNGGRISDDNIVKLGKFVQNGDQITIYVMGEPLGKPLEWTVYRNGGEKKVIDGYAELSDKTEKSTFAEFAMLCYKEEYGISEIDWYNAVVEKLSLIKTNDSLASQTSLLDVSYDLMRWYVYELTVPAKTSVINSVTAPLYPDIHVGYNPPVYRYEYLLSPAAKWNSFGDIDLNIITPHYLNIGDFSVSRFDYSASDSGYSAHLGGLPDGELVFTLCETENPEKVKTSYSSFTDTVIKSWVILVIVVACLGAIIAVIFIINHFKNKKRKAA